MVGDKPVDICMSSRSWVTAGFVKTVARTHVHFSHRFKHVDYNKLHVIYFLNVHWGANMLHAIYKGCSKSKILYFVFLVFFFFRQHCNKLTRGECSRGLYDHTVKIWKLYLCFSSCFNLVSGVASSWCRQIWDAYGNAFFYKLKVCWLTLKVVFQSFSPSNPLLRCPRG